MEHLNLENLDVKDEIKLVTFENEIFFTYRFENVFLSLVVLELCFCAMRFENAFWLLSLESVFW